MRIKLLMYIFYIKHELFLNMNTPWIIYPTLSFIYNVRVFPRLLWYFASRFQKGFIKQVIDLNSKQFVDF